MILIKVNLRSGEGLLPERSSSPLFNFHSELRNGAYFLLIRKSRSNYNNNYRLPAVFCIVLLLCNTDGVFASDCACSNQADSLKVFNTIIYAIIIPNNNN